MKRLKFILLIALVCLSLCSCKELDEMKRCHALDYGDKIELNNQTYKHLDLQFDGYIVVDYGREIWVTEPDVPVLLSQRGFVKYLPSINEDETIISYYDNGHYIREDKYDYYENAIKNGIDYTKFYCGKIGSQSDYNHYYFSDSQNNAFLSFIRSGTPIKTNEAIHTNDFVWVSCESADGFFRKSCIYEIVKTDDGYCVLDYTDDGYYNRYDSTPNYNELFADIFESAKKGECLNEKS